MTTDEALSELPPDGPVNLKEYRESKDIIPDRWFELAPAQRIVDAVWEMGRKSPRHFEELTFRAKNFLCEKHIRQSK